MNGFQYENERESESGFEKKISRKSPLFTACVILVFVFCFALLSLAAVTYLPYQSAFFAEFPFSDALWRTFLPSGIFLPAAVWLCDVNVRRFSLGSKLSVIMLGLSCILPVFLDGNIYFSYTVPSLVFLTVSFSLYFFICDLNIARNKPLKFLFGALYIFVLLFAEAGLIRAAVTGTLVQLKYLFVTPFFVLTPLLFALYEKCSSGDGKQHSLLVLIRCAVAFTYSLVLGFNSAFAYFLLCFCTFCLLFDIHFITKSIGNN